MPQVEASDGRTTRGRLRWSNEPKLFPVLVQPWHGGPAHSMCDGVAVWAHVENAVMSAHAHGAPGNSSGRRLLTQRFLSNANAQVHLAVVGAWTHVPERRRAIARMPW